MGPLTGFTVVEMAGIGPGPFAGMLLADLGADVIRVDRPRAASSPGADGAVEADSADVTSRGRRSVTIDLKSPEGVELVLRLVERADALIEGYRPGVMERLGLGPQECLARNGRLVYGRMTGWGQDGPLAHSAGHDINYISLSGALSAIGRAGQAPVPPLNLVGDYGGGAMLLACGVLAGLLAAGRDGAGQVVDAAMVDGSALLMAPFYGAQAMGRWSERGTNLLDTGAPFYDVYATSDGGHVSVGPIEPQFFGRLLGLLGIADLDPGAQYDPSTWPALRERLAGAFAENTRDHWQEVFTGTDACVAPVLSLAEAPAHPHNVARATFVSRDGVVQPAPAPRFSRTPAEIRSSPPVIGEHTREVLAWIGLDEAEITRLGDAGITQRD
ncbi:CaiB/BaiF CoA transferase family protein [Streptosporangium carneum]|uniref:CoA transferase n=1 Tax=Streptosporangium carneum TaxID=47481 RepID=A0A9W6HYT9_9ACTN|nr:CaiB/BaiF CoA-transferase family protein [Streptosporangium carneum]GLK08572.1 CoA transferase [Streptosporangium carneum]